MGADEPRTGLRECGLPEYHADACVSVPELGSAMRLSNLAGRATIVLRSDGTEYGVGGRGTVLADAEASRIAVEGVHEKWPTTSRTVSLVHYPKSLFCRGT